jgi:immunity protein 8 of polymorphic toxin system
VRAAVRRFHSPDVDDLAKHRPDDAARFCYLLQVMVGPKGGEGEESFDVLLCTPTWLAENLARDSVVVGRHYLLVQEYDFRRVKRFITAFVEDCSGDTWDEVAEQVGRLGKWEFEDYVE